MPSPDPTPCVLITGASSGIGRQTALLFAEQHVRLVLAARGAEALQDVALECVEKGASDVVVQTTDIGEPDDVARLFDVASARFGGVDIVVQNASVAAFGQFTEVPLQVFTAVIHTNVLGAVDVSRTALTHFRTRGRGRLIVVGSLLGHAAVPLMSPYVISKFAVTALVRILRQETRAERGISVYGIYPGAIDTPIYPLSANFIGQRARVLPVKDQPEKVARAIVRRATAGRSGESQIGLANWPMLLGYRLAPRVFDVLVGPLLRTFGFTREPLRETTGNLLDPIHLPH